MCVVCCTCLVGALSFTKLIYIHDATPRQIHISLAHEFEGYHDLLCNLQTLFRYNGFPSYFIDREFHHSRPTLSIKAVSFSVAVGTRTSLEVRVDGPVLFYPVRS